MTHTPRSRSRLLRLCMLIGIVWALAALAIDASGLATPAAPSELGAIFGNGLEADGTPATLLAERLDAGLDCYRAGHCKRLFISGSLDGPGLDETLAMQNYLIQHGVEPHDIVPDRAGDNTLASAQHLIAYMRERHLGSVTLVSQYYHLPRARLAVTRAGGDAFAVYGVYPRTFHLRDLYASWREVPAWLVYRVRLGANPDAQPVTIRPFLSMFNLIRSLFTGEAADVPNYAPSPPSVPAWKT